MKKVVITHSTATKFVDSFSLADGLLRIQEGITGDEGKCLFILSLFSEGPLRTAVDDEVCTLPGLDLVIAVLSAYTDALKQQRSLHGLSRAGTLQ